MQREAALLLLGRFNDDIIVFHSKSQSFDIARLVRTVIACTRSRDTLERGQAVWCLSRFVELISLRSKDMFPEILQGLWDSLAREACRPIAICLVKTINTFSRKMAKLKLRYEGRFDIADVVALEQPSFLVNALQVECLLEFARLSEESRPQICRHIEFLKWSFLKHNGEAHILNSINAIVRLLADKPETCGAFEAAFWPLIAACMGRFVAKVRQRREAVSSEDHDLVSHSLTLLEVLLAKSGSLAPLLPQMLGALRDVLLLCEHNEIANRDSICLKTLVKRQGELLRAEEHRAALRECVCKLLEVTADKSLEGSSLYVGNLVVLTFQCVLGGSDRAILQMVVNKVFRSRTPSVIQSLVLVFAREINSCAKPSTSLSPAETDRLGELIGFLCSFNIDNRIGLKILVDKWLLQQSLFRGRLTKNVTYLALARLFMLRDKTLDNLLVIGFNPSHTNITSVPAPLKILSTLIRCLDHLSGGARQSDFQQEEPEDEPRVQVDLEKFRDEDEQELARKGGLAELEGNGSTCYMSAMLEFYDDGEECDETTEEDL
jgi:hypothetical protein